MATKSNELKINDLLTKHEALIEYEANGDFELTLNTPLTPEEISILIGHYVGLYPDHVPMIWCGDDGCTIKLAFWSQSGMGSGRQ